MARKRCATCGSKRFHKDAASGQVVCEDGHVVEAFTQETEGDRVSYSQRTRREKGPEKKAKVKTVRTGYTGAKGRYLQLQALQILLRKQIAALQDLFGFPDELEIIARDLWACYTSSIDLEPAPLIDDREDSIAPSTVRSSVAPRPPSPESDASIHKRMELDVDSDSDSEDSEAAVETDRSRSATTSTTKTQQQSSSDEETEAEAKPKRKKGVRKKPRYVTNEYDPRKAVHAWYTLVICYLSCVTFRLPIMVNDLLQLARIGKLPYLNAVDDLPEAMWPYISTSMWPSLDVSHIPKVVVYVGEQGLYNWIRRFAELYEFDFGISFPEINASPLLWRCVKSFALTPLVYMSARRMLSLAEVDLRLNGIEEDEGSKQARNAKSASAHNPPELIVAAAIVLCIRLLWTLEDEPRQPFDLTDPLATLFKRDDLLAGIDKLGKVEAKHDATTTWSEPIETLSDLQIDEYLDHLESALDKPSRPPKDISVVNRVFSRECLDPRSTSSSPAASIDKTLASLYASMRPPDVTEHEPTEFLPLKRYRTTDTVGLLPEAMDKVLARAAAIVGVSSEQILHAVSQLERRLLKAG